MKLCCITVKIVLSSLVLIDIASFRIMLKCTATAVDFCRKIESKSALLPRFSQEFPAAFHFSEGGSMRYELLLPRNRNNSRKIANLPATVREVSSFSLEVTDFHDEILSSRLARSSI